MQRISSALFGAALLAAACSPEAPATGAFEGELIYGADDRVEYYETTAARQAAVDSTAAVVNDWDLSPAGSGWTLDTSTTWGQQNNLCNDEPFRDQPASAFCSAFLVGPNLMATAGHCITRQRDCNSTSFVFGFRLDSAAGAPSTYAADDVYECVSIVTQKQRSGDDYAVVQLDRPVVGRAPLEIRRTGTIPSGQAVYVAGHPAGIPLKVAGGANVTANTAAQYFEANLDTYGGNSGSAVFNADTHVVEGILVRGNADYAYDGSRGCYVSNTCSNSGCPGWEDASRTTRFASFVPPLGGVELCSNGLDDDGDGAIDCADSDCASDQACLPAEVCTGGLDEDGDGDIDCADADCIGDPACSAGPTCNNDNVCGLGESCDGRSGTAICGDCPGVTSGKPSNRFCYVEGACTGPGCP